MREPCPPPATLERFALHGEGASGLAGHVDRCPACREYVEDARENEAFLGRAAPALAEARPAPREPIDPHAVDGFELVEEISRGGQGVVYRAVQAATHRPAAVKMLLAGAFASDRQRRRFEREVEIAARLRHPNVVTVFESGQTPDGRPFVAMEFVNGVPIDRYVRDRLPEPGRDRTDAVLRLFLAIASGVAAAHAAGVIHRDLKPSNVLVDADGVPRVLDFGLARPITDHPEATVTHEFAGTPAYAAPEQFIGDAAAIGTATDVYALGVMLYTALTGRHPYPRDGSLAELAQHAASTDPAPPSRYVDRAQIAGEGPRETLPQRRLDGGGHRRLPVRAADLRAARQRRLRAAPAGKAAPGDGCGRARRAADHRRRGGGPRAAGLGPRPRAPGRAGGPARQPHPPRPPHGRRRRTRPG
ncbi:serine/threonine protein kinase [Synechococcales cyanobacterium CNB]|nr:serine/threonine protein kinase [Synechococcales cyanobacterium CNB]